MNRDDLVALVVALPLLAAAILPIVRHILRRRLPIDIFSIVFLTLLLAIDAVVLADSLRQPFVYWFGGWRDIGVVFLVEPAGMGCAAFAALLALAGMVYSAIYFQAHGPFFHSLMLAFVGAMSGFCLSADLFNQFVFFEMMGIAAYALTAYKIEETGPLEGGFNFAVMNSIGAIAVLAGIALLYGRTGALGMAEIGMRLREGPPDVLVWTALTLLLAGYLVKGAVVPFHLWLPDAHAVAPTAVSVLFSGVMVEIALLGIVRVWHIVFSGALVPYHDGIGLLFVGLGSLTAIVGGVMCLLQRHLKRLLAFSTVSHIGVMTAALGFFNPKGLAGMFVYVVGHGLVKGTLFLCGGIILHRKKSVDELDLCGACRDLRVTGVAFLVAGGALAGFPPFGTFAGKSLIEEGARSGGYGFFVPVALAASAMTAAAVLRAGARMFLGLGKTDLVTGSAVVSGSTEQQETRGQKRRTPLVMLLPTLALIVLAAASGLVNGISAGADSAAHFLQGDLACVLTSRSTPLHLPEGVAHSPAFSAYVAAAAVLAGAVAIAAIMLSGRVGGGRWTAILQLLRRLHSGYVGDYAAWFTAGTALILVWLIAVAAR